MCVKTHDYVVFSVNLNVIKGWSETGSWKSAEILTLFTGFRSHFNNNNKENKKIVSVFQRQTKSEYSATHQLFFSEIEKKIMAQYANLQNVSLSEEEPKDLLATLVYETDIYGDLIKTEVTSPAPANVCK